jgi:hypothetical protein
LEPKHTAVAPENTLRKTCWAKTMDVSVLLPRVSKSLFGKVRKKTGRWIDLLVGNKVSNSFSPTGSIEFCFFPISFSFFSFYVSFYEQNTAIEFAKGYSTYGVLPYQI